MGVGGRQEGPGPGLLCLPPSVLSHLGAEQDVGVSIALPPLPGSLHLELEANLGMIKTGGHLCPHGPLPLLSVTLSVPLQHLVMYHLPPLQPLQLSLSLSLFSTVPSPCCPGPFSPAFLPSISGDPEAMGRGVGGQQLGTGAQAAPLEPHFCHLQVV